MRVIPRVSVCASRLRTALHAAVPHNAHSLARRAAARLRACVMGVEAGCRIAPTSPARREIVQAPFTTTDGELLFNIGVMILGVITLAVVLSSMVSAPHVAHRAAPVQ